MRFNKIVASGWSIRPHEESKYRKDVRFCILFHHAPMEKMELTPIDFRPDIARSIVENRFCDWEKEE